MLIALPPLAAYRDDLARAGREILGDRDGEWLEIFQLVERLGRLASDGRERRERLVRLVERRMDALSLPLIRGKGDPDAVDPRWLHTRLRVLSVAMEDASAFNLAFSLLHAIRRAYPGETIPNARLLTDMGRVARVVGARDVQERLVAELFRMAKQERSDELYARGCAHSLVLSHERGNYPEAERWAREGLARVGEAEHPRLVRVFRLGQMIHAAVHRDWDVAIAHGWDVYRLSEGHPPSEIEALINLSRLLTDAGHHASAARGFKAVLERRPSVEAQLYAWAGFARAAAGIGDPALVELASNRIMALAEIGGHPYPSAVSLVSAATARAALGLPNEMLIDRATAIAERGRYHQVSHELVELREDAARRSRARHHTSGEGSATAARAPFDPSSVSPEVGRVLDALNGMSRLEDAHAMS